MKIDIVIVYLQRYRVGHEFDFVPPITGIHLAAITPARHQVRVIHQQVEPVDLDTDADLVALSFFSGFAEEAYRLAAKFRHRGKTVVAGGPHVTYCAEEALKYVDAVVTGEAETAWQQLLADFETGFLKNIYTGMPSDMRGLPTPRYELLKGKYIVPKVVQATRGCPFHCSFCSVPTLNPGFRMRPVEEVLENIRYDRFPYWWQRKIVWFWDDNLTINRTYIRNLLEGMVPLKKWWLTQASLDIARDEELLELMRRSGCIGIFFGIESFGTESLGDANKRQNKVEHYKKAVDALHRKGICVMAGFIAGFDHDTPETIEAMADQLLEIGVDVPFLSVLTPFKGTPLYDKLEAEERLIADRGWSYYNGYNVAFEPQSMSSEALLKAHRRLWSRAFSVRHVLTRALRSVRYLRPGAFMMAACMNLFYGWKRLRGNYPVDAAAFAGTGMPRAERVEVELYA